MEGLAAQLGGMATQVLALVLVLFVANMFGLWMFHRWQPMSIERVEGSVSPGYRRLFLAGLKPLVAVIAGLLAGYYLLPDMPMAEQLATWSLMLLLFLIGLQLRNAGLSLRKLLMNRQGLGIALALTLSSLVAGALLIPWLGLPWHDALAVASGFGWYSLSGIVIGEALGPAWGGVAFLNDPLVDCQQAGHGYWLWWRYRHGLHPAGYPQQWRADLCSGGDRLRFLAVFSLAGADGGVPVFGIN